MAIGIDGGLSEVTEWIEGETYVFQRCLNGFKHILRSFRCG